MHATFRSLRLRVLQTLAAAALVGGCSTNPATGKSEISLVSESQEIEMGNQMLTSARASLGTYPDSGVQRYAAHRFYFARRLVIQAYHFGMDLHGKDD